MLERPIPECGEWARKIWPEVKDVPSEDTGYVFRAPSKNDHVPFSIFGRMRAMVERLCCVK